MPDGMSHLNATGLNSVYLHVASTAKNILNCRSSGTYSVALQTRIMSFHCMAANVANLQERRKRAVREFERVNTFLPVVLYHRYEMRFRSGQFFSSAPLASFAGALTYYVTSCKSKLADLRLLFLVEGIPRTSLLLIHCLETSRTRF
ncbi:hypothetical protein V1520DRAFT_358676 [Lipomyces starkeyi]